MEVMKEKVVQLENELAYLKKRVKHIEEQSHARELNEQHALNEIRNSLKALENELKNALTQSASREKHALDREVSANIREEKALRSFYWAIGLVAALLIASIVESFS
ncbi:MULTISPECIES: hypothetical protein [Listeria]|uniref:hypothetical protein n=1 Tax=Listeria TaxID=1637 RepID=UPI000B58ED53|nr:MULTISPECIES: hypothetical protein [Listeria]